MRDINKQKDSFSDLNNTLSPELSPSFAADSTQAAQYVTRKETNLEHRTRVLSELAAQGILPCKEKRGKHLSRYFCFHSPNKKSSSITPVNSEDDITQVTHAVKL